MTDWDWYAEARAEAWDEGYNAGFDNGADAARQWPLTRYDNPYRADASDADPTTSPTLEDQCPL